MRTIGLIGGMSWESTITYYSIINESVKNMLGGLHSAKIILYSVDFFEIEKYQANGEWDKSAEVLGTAAKALETAGADFIVICTNTMHKVVPQIKNEIRIPILHIAKATADELIAKKIKKAALLGTKYTMTQNFYKEILINSGIDIIIPKTEDIDYINNVIYNELCLGKISKASKQGFIKIIEKLEKAGAECVILGCTEIGLLITQADTELLIFDTTKIHAEKAAYYAINEFDINS